MTAQDKTPERSRRVIISSSMLGGSALVAALAACGSDGTADTPGTTDTSATTASGGADAATTIAASQVPVGGGTILGSAKVVVTQPAAGQYQAFSAVCTHEGCLVSTVADNVITCACHGSTFSAQDGSVLSAPATEPLAAKRVTVDGDTLRIG